MQAIYLKRLPIRRISFSTPEPERLRLVEKMKALYSTGDLDQVLKLVEGCLPLDEQGNPALDKEKSDVVHDLLAFLAERMIERNKEKQAEIRGFLGWLEGETGVPVEEMTLKTKIREYYKIDWKEFRKALLRNKTKITKCDVSQEEVLEKIRGKFEVSMGRFEPLFVRIEETDRLIDAIVYRLYGLTEEEIGVVEGSG